jgi:hypothetical protein
MNGTLSTIRYLFTIVGLGALCGALLLYRQDASFVAHASRAQGTVTALAPRHSSDTTTYSPVVRFQHGPQQIEFADEVSRYPPAYDIGETVSVLYVESNPYDAKIETFSSLWAGAAGLGGLGTVFLAIGAGMIVVPLLTRRTDERLLHEGRPVEADFQGVHLNTAISVNGRCPFRVTAQWLDPSTAQVRVFESHNLWFDPTSYMKDKKIRVFLDTNNPNKYYVDLSFLPKLAG